MVGAHVSSSGGMADKTRDAVRDKLRPLLKNVRVSHRLSPCSSQAVKRLVAA